MNGTGSHGRKLHVMVWSILCGITVMGCGSDPDQQFVLEHPDELHTVAGKVYFNGEPIQGAIVTFFAAPPANPSAIPAGDPLAASEAATQPHGRTSYDGTYEIDTPGPGAPVGEYLVTVSWKGPGTSGASNLPEKLPQKYQDPMTSGLKATVKPGDNLIPTFELN